MDKDFALQLTDLRLLQTCHLLGLLLDGDHDPTDRERINAVFEAVSAAHEIVKRARSSPDR